MVGEIVDFDCYALEYRKIPRKIYAGVIARAPESRQLAYLVNTGLLSPQVNETAYRIMRTLKSSLDFHAELERITPRFGAQWAIETLGRDLAETGKAMTDRLKKSWLDEYQEEPGEKPKLSRRRLLFDRARTAFGNAIDRVTMNLPMHVFTYAQNKMTIDFAFALNEDLKMFHVVSLTANLDPAFVLAQRYKRISNGAFDKGCYKTTLTAIVEDGIDFKDQSIEEAVEALYNSSIIVRPVSELRPIVEELPNHQRIEVVPATEVPGTKTLRRCLLTQR